ncbi:MAG: SRPBCC family protein [Pseudomonadales bacterium]|jgi:uncharacterized protein YndB with AHSA1/START domain|nr:SRPBCC family protein [Pseudomonadales bacterium]
MKHEMGRLIAPGTIQFIRRLPGPVERIWEWVTVAEKRAQWLAGGAWQLAPGGRVELVFRNDTLCHPGDRAPEAYADMPAEMRFKGEVLEIAPPRLIEFLLIEQDGQRSRVRIELTPEGDEVELRLTQFDMERFGEKLSVAAGWHAHLEVFCAKARGIDAPSFWVSFREAEESYRVVIGDGAAS